MKQLPLKVREQLKEKLKVANNKVKALSIESSTEEITDTVFDFAVSIETVEESLEDDFQLTDVLSWVGLEDEGREIINDAPTFFGQLTAANPTRVKEAIAEADVRFLAAGKKYGKVSAAFMNGLYGLALWYETGSRAYTDVQTNIALSKDLFAGKRILPN